ncbi:hypothetical protein [Haladaptatus halobius]|uniref:hypothetical protein n=1 Tax=Haladaptatus halobius TaxID=2884875 RepID=UPI001D0A6D3C|nr:hypothetical protein [Haladaptatus halobius]
MTESETPNSGLPIQRTFDALDEHMYGVWNNSWHERVNALISMKATDRENTREESR